MANEAHMAKVPPSPTEAYPLAGYVVALTREVDDRPALTMLTKAGARLVALPLTYQVDTPAFAELVERLAAKTPFDVLLFTSRNAVLSLARALRLAQVSPDLWAKAQIWVVGPQTGQAVSDYLGRSADAVAEEATGEGLAHLMAKSGHFRGQRVLFPVSAKARRIVPEALIALGADLTELPVYDTIPHPLVAESLRTYLAEGLRLTLLASPSAAETFAKALDTLGLARDVTPVAVIGPVTEKAALALGLRVLVKPPKYSMGDLGQAILDAVTAGTLR